MIATKLKQFSKTNRIFIFLVFSCFLVAVTTGNVSNALGESLPVDVAGMFEGIKESEQKYCGGANMSFISRYTWRGQYYTQGPGWQPELWGSAYGFVGSIWGSMVLDNEPYQGEFSEIDLSLMYTYKYKKLLMVPGYVQYLYPATNTSSSGEAFLLLDYELHKYVHLFTSHYFDLIRYRKSYYGTLGVAFVYDFKEIFSFKAALAQSWGSTRFNEVNFGVNKWTLSGLSLDTGLNVAVLDWLSVNPYISYEILTSPALRTATGEPNLITVGFAIGVAF